jgi:hypothetical protein
MLNAILQPYIGLYGTGPSFENLILFPSLCRFFKIFEMGWWFWSRSLSYASPLPHLIWNQLLPRTPSANLGQSTQQYCYYLHFWWAIFVRGKSHICEESFHRFCDMIDSQIMVLSHEGQSIVVELHSTIKRVLWPKFVDFARTEQLSVTHKELKIPLLRLQGLPPKLQVFSNFY